ncbi:50S ribosomal protein L5 [Candidatus Woesearchaeota archaeon]|nr:50S ribosomal protein L5 [Candidatus Woesearchaeota archaeon]
MTSSQTLHPMREIRVEKVTLNIGAGKDQNVLEKGVKLLKNLTGRVPVKTLTQKRIAAWGLRPGLPIGCMVTLRKDKAVDLLSRTLDAKDYQLDKDQFDDQGNLSFGVPEYIDIRDAKYDPEIGVLGLQVSVTLERPGFRIKKRRLQQKKIPPKHRITKEEAIEFMRSRFKVKFESEQEGEK